jgi:acyl-CoA synthetase (NDP forming)
LLDKSLEFLFNPESVAIVGASENPTTYGYAFMHHLKSYGFRGRLYPINPRQPEISGVKTYPSLEAIPGSVEYVIHLIGVNHAPDIITQAAQKGAKAVHILAGRAGETGRPEGKRLEAEILKRARENGIRVLGPNCLGIYCPKTGLAFGFDFPREPGKVGALIQSGGNSTDLMHIAALRGIRFNKVVSYGNALDINEITCCHLQRRSDGSGLPNNSIAYRLAGRLGQPLGDSYQAGGRRTGEKPRPDGKHGGGLLFPAAAKR